MLQSWDLLQDCIDVIQDNDYFYELLDRNLDEEREVSTWNYENYYGEFQKQLIFSFFFKSKLKMKLFDILQEDIGALLFKNEGLAGICLDIVKKLYLNGLHIPGTYIRYAKVANSVHNINNMLPKGINVSTVAQKFTAV